MVNYLHLLKLNVELGDFYFLYRNDFNKIYTYIYLADDSFLWFECWQIAQSAK